MKRKNVIGGAIVLAGVGFAAYSLWPKPIPPATLTWAPGTEHVYSLAWRTSTDTRAGQPGENALSSKLAIDGDVVIDGYGQQGDAFVLTVRFEHLTRAEVSALGQSLLPTLDDARNQLETRSAEVFVKPNGEVADVRFRAKDPALFRYVMQAVVNELGVQVRGANEKSWTADLEGPSGHGTVQFVRDPDRPFVVTRTRDPYASLAAWPLGEPPPQKLTSTGEVKLAAGGTIAELEEHESLEAAREGQAKDVASETSFQLKKKAERTFDASIPLDGFDQELPPVAERGETEEAKKARLEERTRGVTVDSLLDDVRIHALAPQGKRTRWVWVAEGYFQLYPEKADEFAKKMADLDSPSKGFAIDLLVIGGNEHCQQALVRSFENGTIKSSEESAMLPRLARLREPSKATVQWVSDRYAKTKDDGAALALGGLIAGLAPNDRLAARAFDDALVLDLHAAKTTHQRSTLLLSLGNAALEEDALSVRVYAGDPSADVRDAVATALRRFDDPETRQTLIQLFRDSNIGVQRDALRSLDRRELEPGELALMSMALLDNRVAATNVEALVNFLAARKDTKEGDAMLAILSTRTDIDFRTLARIERIRQGA